MLASATTRPKALRRPRVSSKAGIWLFHVALPPAIFWLLMADPALDQLQHVPQIHFFLVSLTAIAGLVIAWIVAKAARAHQDSRVFFISIAFFGISGIFLMHALSTESILLNQGQAGFIWSPPLCLLIGSLFFALSSFRLNNRVNSWILLNQNRLLVAFLAMLLGYAIVLVIAPNLIVGGLGLPGGQDGGYSVTGEGGAASAALAITLGAAVILFLTAAVRYFLHYRKRRSILLIAILTGMVLFAEADVIMAFSTAWHMSWWLYHAVMVSAFLIVGYGLRVEYSKRGSIYGLFDTLFLREQIARLDRNYTETIVALINSLEAKDRYTKGHSARVAQYSVVLGRALGYGETDLHRLEQAALLHDIGKLAIPDAILNKSGKLTDEEFAFIKSHPVRGCAIIRSIDSLQDKIPGILHHHEWMNGSGYPEGLAGEDIPLDARIIAVADVFDAMTSLRAYRQPLSREAAIEHLRSQVPEHLDERCVESFVMRLAVEEIHITDFTAQITAEDLLIISARETAVSG